VGRRWVECGQNVGEILVERSPRGRVPLDHDKCDKCTGNNLKFILQSSIQLS
jgi:hypothetical protein